MKAAIEQVFDGSIEQVAIGGAYDPTKINRGKHTGQFNLSSKEIDKFIGPSPLDAISFSEAPGGASVSSIHVYKFSDDKFWIFAGTALTGSATRTVYLVEWTRSTNTYNFRGSVILTFPVAGNQTARAIRAVIDNYTTGTVGVSGTTVTGSGTAWATGLSVGSRIGFGSTDPTQITTWYSISAIGSDTSITLSQNAGTISAGTPYVIQDFMILMATVNASTSSLGGLFVAKGLRYEDFTPAGTTIPAATTVDKIKAVYFLRDAATGTATAASGIAIDDRVSWTEQYVYLINGATSSMNILKYNFRAPISPTSGGVTLTGNDILLTGVQGVSGTIITINNGRVATLNHGSGQGVPSLYILTTNRVYRAPLSSITAGSTFFLTDSMLENTPSGPSSTVASGSSAFQYMDIAGSLDKIVITNTAAISGALYVTDYYTGGQQLDRRACHISGHSVSGGRDTEIPIYLHYVSTQAPALWVEDGWLFWFYSTTTAGPNSVTVYPLAADWEFQNEAPNRIICPKITLGEVPKKLYRVMVNDVENLGGSRLGVAPDAYRVQVRFSGIDDNSGEWITLPQNGDLSGFNMTTAVQFAFQFRTLGVTMLPARVTSLALLYEDQDEIPPQYKWNSADTVTSSGTHAWVQMSLFGSTPGVHTIEIFRADTNQLVLTQKSTGTENGNFQNWNGSSWVAGIGADTVGRRRRFVPTASLPANVDFYARLTVG